MTLDALAGKSDCCRIRSSRARMIFFEIAVAAFLLLLNACGSTGNNSTGNNTTGGNPAPPNTSSSLATRSPGFMFGVVGVSYNASLSASGGKAPYSWQLTSGSLPSGLVVNTNGQISGTPQAAASSTFTMQVKDSAAATASIQLTLTIYTPGSLDGPAVLPMTFSATFPSQASANVYNVTSGDATDLENKITSAANNCGATGAVVIVPVATYTTANTFTIPATNCDSTHWLVIESADLSLLPAQGTRITVPNVNLPVLISTGINGEVINIPDVTSNPPHNIWIAGLEIAANITGTNEKFSLVQAGDNTGVTSTMSASNLVNHVTVDRCWLHGGVPGATTDDMTVNVHHGVDGTASYLAVEDSVINMIHDVGIAQSQAINTYNSFGPFDIGNNELSAMGEDIIFGGADPTITGQVMSDIYIHHNWIHAPDAWMSPSFYGGNFRNFIECKICRRVLIEGNVFKNEAGASQSASIQLTPRNSNGQSFSSTVEDVTLRYNWFMNVSDWISILGANDATNGNPGGWTSFPTKRVNIHDNAVENLNFSTYPGNGRWIQLALGNSNSANCSGAPLTLTCEVSDITISHNSLVSGEATTATRTFITFADIPTAGTNQASNINIVNNIAPAGAYLIGSDSGSVHPLTGVFNPYFSSYTFDHNAITGTNTAGYTCSDFPPPISNFCGGIGQPAAMASVGFTNYNGGTGGLGTTNYLLTATGPYHNAASDGTDVGANISALTSHTSTAMQGTPQP